MAWEIANWGNYFVISIYRLTLSSTNSMKKNLVLYILIIILFCKCNFSSDKNTDFEEDKTFPTVKNLSQFEQTIFLPTLESELGIQKNGIYAASLLMAWDEIKNGVSDSVKNIESPTLNLMNQSTSYQTALAKNEYSSSVDISFNRIAAQAFFKKSLPFVYPFERDKNCLAFQKDSVVSFGVYEPQYSVKIFYYNHDNDFAVKLLPKDDKHEIILLKSDFSTATSIKKILENLEITYSEFKKDKSSLWKHYFEYEDSLRIPIIEFNIETRYSEIEETTFFANKKTFVIDTFYQRTAFVLNEKGAEVESEAEISATETPAMAEKEPQRPKKLFFDKPYLVMLKRVDSPFPYFAMFVANSELMIKK